MAHFSGTFYSDALSRKVSFTAIIPTTKEAAMAGPGENENRYKQPRRTLYLMHGWMGDHTDWLLNTRITEIAEKFNLAVILPAGENSFYVDHPDGTDHGQFIGSELVEVSRELFPLSTKREDTWIAGLSMGGFGALRNGFNYAKTFSKIAAFSSPILTKKEAPNREKLGNEKIELRLKHIIGSVTLADLSVENDVYDLVLNRKEEQGIYIACGLDDDILEANQAFHRYLLEHNIPHEYHETPGGHDWDFWNEYIVKAVEWMMEN